MWNILHYWGTMGFKKEIAGPALTFMGSGNLHRTFVPVTAAIRRMMTGWCTR